ncbi:hypothetical protein CYFUS_000673 [Cystobacter fuscus]|uniref:Lipoprotein n=1 Tax=Cystobacter fuscus TaxID=43 RepID=A0A250IVS4_9BACT|nr:hypothetical protein [Cystobacter fuscus]ATB35261.1 hypothetical protein CYFUS_000673 [Cystobacter fuscus]
MRTRITALILATVTGLAGCGPSDSEACKPVSVLDAQGGAYRCVASEDCPRSPTMTLCVRDIPGPLECIRCLDTYCVRVPPETC